MLIESFHPPFLFRSYVTQTLLASLRLEKYKKNRMYLVARERQINVQKGVKLIGYHSERESNSKGLVLLLHGWEGDVASSYVLKTGDYLYEKGFDIFRLNFRDHGDTHHLNVELFNGSLLPEIFEAAKEIGKLSGKNPFYIAGFSLGGNFALRIANKNNKGQIPSLKHVAAVSPAINPKLSTLLMDKNPFLRRFFLREWIDSLFQKASYFPDKYDFKPFLDAKSVMELTERIIPAFSAYKNADEYFNTYTLTGDYFKNLKIPVTIVSAKDDPVVSPKDFYELAPNPLMNIILTDRGGHNGFFTDYGLMNPWYLRIIEQAFGG